MSISPIQPPGMAELASLEPTKGKGPELGGGFTKALTEARGLERDSVQAAEKFANGDASVGIHEVMIAAEKANVAVRYVTTLKNKAIEAYHELMNTQV